MLGEWVTGSALDCYDYYSTIRWNLKTWTLHFCVFVFVFTSELERHSHWSKSRDKSWDASRRLQWPEGSTSRSSSLHTQTQKNKVGREKTKLSWVGRVPCACKLKLMVIHENFCPIFNFKMQVVTQWRASEQLCSSTIVTTDATKNIQVSTRPPAPITRQPPHLDENIWNQNLLDRLLEYIRLPREMFWKTSFELFAALLLVAATRHFVSADCLWEEKVSVFKGSSTTTKNLQYLWWNLKTPYRASKAQIKSRAWWLPQERSLDLILLKRKWRFVQRKVKRIRWWWWA